MTRMFFARMFFAPPSSSTWSSTRTSISNLDLDLNSTVDLEVVGQTATAPIIAASGRPRGTAWRLCLTDQVDVDGGDVEVDVEDGGSR